MSCPSSFYVFVVVDFQQEAFQCGEQRILLKVADWPAKVKTVGEINPKNGDMRNFLHRIL